MAKAAVKAKLIKVFCESCLRQFSQDCVICHGLKYYLWDPKSLLCYLASGEPMLTVNEAGDSVTVFRNRPQERTQRSVSGDPGRLDLSLLAASAVAASEPLLSSIQPPLTEMLSTIQRWVEADSRRKWKMWLEDGWNCCLWQNRHRGPGIHITHSDPAGCVGECYRRILAIELGISPLESADTNSCNPCLHD